MKKYEQEMLRDAIHLAIIKSRTVIRMKRIIWILAAVACSLSAALIIVLIAR